MLKFFPEKSDLPAHTSVSLLKQFAIALDARLDQQDLSSINALQMSAYEREIELRAQETSMTSSLMVTMTTKGVLLATHPTLDENERITLASLEQVRDYYKQLADIVIQRKKGSCVGLAAVALALSSDLIAESQYQHIEVQVIYLHHWGHALIRLTHPGERTSLFYDPWYQRCQKSSTPVVPMLIEASELAAKMNCLVDGDAQRGIPTIRHIDWLTPYDAKKQQWLSYPQESCSLDFSYCIVCSSGRFSNPSHAMSEPEGRDHLMSPSSVCVVS